jgi:zinc/manganese transport system permease protein
MSLGGFVAGIVVALLAGLATRFTLIKEDASFAGFYLLSLALGVLLVSTHGNSVDLIHILFGSVLAIDQNTLILMGGVTSVTLVVLALIYRPLLLEIVDPVFSKAVGGRGAVFHHLFLFLVVINLVAGFQSMGTLMAVGLMMLPPICAQLWSQKIGWMLFLSVLFALISGVVGLLVSYHFELPSGPAIILLTGVFYIFSLLFGSIGGFIPRYIRVKHFQR